MATIKLTGDLGLDADIKPAPFSSLVKYFQQLPAMRLVNSDLSRVAGLTLDQPAVKQLTTGLSFDKAVASIGPGANAISISAGAHGSIEIVKRTPDVTALPDISSGEIKIGDNLCYVGFGVQASVGVAVGPDAGSLQFGVGPGESIDLRYYQAFPLHGTSVLEAVRQTVGDFLIPASVDDLQAMPAGSVAAATGTGCLKLSGTANLLTVTNPLASVTLPDSLPALSVTAGGAVAVSASFEVKSTFQLCAQKTDAGHMLLGWYRQKAADVAVTATLSEGISAGFGSTDLFSKIIGVASKDAAADIRELQKAGLPPDQVSAIHGAVQAAVCRKLQLALSSEIDAGQSGSAAFLYNVDIAALTPDSRNAIDQALRGDLSGLHAGPLAGVTEVHSVWTRARASQVKFELNLLGILNVGSISSLTASGSVLFEPATGALTITDKASAQRIQSTAVNFGADTQKLRHVLSECFLLTATYQGMQHQVGAPSLKSSYDFFDLENNTSAADMARELRVGSALGLFSAEDATPPAGIADFGRTTIYARTSYEDSLASALFLDSGGEPRPEANYETAGRDAIQLLVHEGDDDQQRRQPAVDNDLWSRMRALGQPSFRQMFPDVSDNLLADITADYTAIVWWAGAMAGAGRHLAAIRKWFGDHPSAAQDDPEFVKLRRNLAAHLKDVVSKTSQRFGEPWGLIAMDDVSARRAAASILVTGPRLVRSRQRPLTAAAT